MIYIKNITMRKVKKVKCTLCGHDISAQNIKKHTFCCNGLGTRTKRPKSLRPRSYWCKGKTYDEIYGVQRSLQIRNKLSKSLIGKSSGKCLDPKKEKERRKKIALAMKGNKNGATLFRRKKIEYNGIIFKSNWEANTAEFFDNNNIKWKYEDKTYDLSETTSYTPDFSLYEHKIFIKHIEVKGYFRKENKEKFEKFKRLNPNINIELWMKKDLLKKGISILRRDG